MTRTYSALLILLALLASAPLAAYAAPIASIEKPDRTFPDTENTKEVRERFTIKNTGDEPLILSDLYTSCGCTSAYLDEKTVLPGKSTFVEVTFNLAGTSGLQVANTSLKTNDPASPNLKFTLQGNALSFVEVIPKQVFFPQTHGTEKSQTTADILSAQQTPFEIKSITSTQKWLTVTASPVDKEKGHHRLTFTIPPGLPQGMNTAQVKITTDNPKFPIINIPVAVPITGLISVSPQSIDLTLPSDTSRAPDPSPDPVTRNIILTLNDPDPAASFTITSATIEKSPQAKITITQSAGNRSARIRISNLTPDIALNGQHLTLVLSYPNLPKLQVPIKVQQAK
jgi:hypothetical protein